MPRVPSDSDSPQSPPAPITRVAGPAALTVIVAALAVPTIKSLTAAPPKTPVPPKSQTASPQKGKEHDSKIPIVSHPAVAPTPAVKVASAVSVHKPPTVVHPITALLSARQKRHLKQLQQQQQKLETRLQESKSKQQRAQALRTAYQKNLGILRQDIDTMRKAGGQEAVLRQKEQDYKFCQPILKKVEDEYKVRDDEQKRLTRQIANVTKEIARYGSSH